MTGAPTSGIPDGTLLAALKHGEAHVMSAEFSPDGTRIVTASVDEPARIWTRLRHPTLIAELEKRLAERQLSSDECSQYRIDPCDEYPPP